MSRLLRGWLVVFFAFLYLPIGFLIVFSFNSSRLVTLWTGFSTRWYAVLLHDQALIEATLVSLRIAAQSATIAAVIGTAAGYVLARFGPFRGRTLFEASVATPLVLPDVITGLMMLLFFVMLEQMSGWPQGRGIWTVTLAHASVSMAYVTVVIRARLTDEGTILEEAAMDLAAPPWRTFLEITLPLMAPALISGWLLAFTLSIDDVVIASFTSGPGASTMPMVVFSMTRLGTTPEIYALATIIVVVVVVFLLVVNAAWGRLRRLRL